jgi:hypothetical protein
MCCCPYWAKLILISNSDGWLGGQGKRSMWGEYSELKPTKGQLDFASKPTLKIQLS